MDFEFIIQDIKEHEQNLNYSHVHAPFTPNTFSLWRDMRFKYVKKEDQLEFIQRVDGDLFFVFLNKVRENYHQNLTFKDLKLDLKFDVDPKKIESILTKDLKNDSDQLIHMLATWQTEIEYSYDLLRRVHLYGLVQIENNVELNLSEKQRKVYSRYLEKMMNGLIDNIQDVTTSKIKEICATTFIKNNSVYDSGKQLLKNLLFSQTKTLSLLSNLNVGLFIGGLVAEAVVNKVGLTLLASHLQKKLQQLAIELQEMSNELVKVNYGLDQLITACMKEEAPQDAIKAYIQKNYRVSTGPDTFYDAENDKIIQMIDDGSTVIVTQKDYNIQVVEEDESVIICEPMIVQKQYY